MYLKILFTLSIFVYVGGYEASFDSRPIIGILSQEMSHILQRHYPDRYHSYIAASYVKFIEGSGARVAPIWIGKPKSYYEDILSKVNGVIFPGGNTYFNQSDGYADAAEHIYEIAKKFNDRGDYFPILGICLGFEALTYLEANKTEHRERCNSRKQSLPLEFTTGYQKSKLYRSLPDDIRNILKHENVTVNSHIFCVTESNLREMNIDHLFRITSVNKDWDGFEFISSIEHVTYPFFGIQFHPEKNAYEWIKGHNLPHDYNAIKASRYFADFIVNEARQNTHSFKNSTEEELSLIYNYNTFYTALKKSVFVQCYLFEN